MRNLIMLSTVLVVGLSTTAYAGPPADPGAWGQATKGAAQLDTTDSNASCQGSHSSNQDSPRLGLGNFSGQSDSDGHRANTPSGTDPAGTNSLEELAGAVGGAVPAGCEVPD